VVLPKGRMVESTRGNGCDTCYTRVVVTGNSSFSRLNERIVSTIVSLEGDTARIPRPVALTASHDPLATAGTIVVAVYPIALPTMGAAILAASAAALAAYFNPHPIHETAPLYVESTYDILSVMTATDYSVG
jgi:hypothetical protein